METLTGLASNRRTWLACLLLALATLAIYWPVRHYAFVEYDDDDYVSNNPVVRAGLSWSNFVWAFDDQHACNWHPLTWLSHMLDRQLFGAHPGPQHIVNVLLHTANAVLLFLVLLRMTGLPWRSAFVAVLFAWHPAHVESVAWIAERKDVLSTLFFLLTLLAYRRYTLRKNAMRFALVALFFVLGLMAKPMLVTLPFVLLLLDYWPLERLCSPRQFWPLVVEKIPLFALSAASCVVTFVVQKSNGAVASLESVSIYERLGNATLSYARYLGTLFFPVHLIVPYAINPGTNVLAVCGAAIGLVFATIAAIEWGSRCKYIPVAWFWYLGTLVPVIGIVQVGSQAMADRYTYIPSVGIFIAVVWGAAELLPRRVCAVAGVAVLALCAALTVRQLGYWKNSETLFKHTLAIDPANLDAVNGLAWTYATDPDPALRNGAKAVQFATQCVDTSQRRFAYYLDTLAAAYAEAGDFPRAVETAHEALTRPELKYQPLLAEEIRAHLEIYKKGNAIHAL
jgi:protein O-mannosyl-transferase